MTYGTNHLSIGGGRGYFQGEGQEKTLLCNYVCVGAGGGGVVTA